MAEDSRSLEQLENVFAQLESIPGSSRGVTVAPEFAERALVLEYGSVAGRRPWPQPGERTVLAIDPETGSQVVLSAQAPQGFIRVHAHEFAEQLTSELSRASGWLDSEELHEHLEAAVHVASDHALRIIRDAIPRDSSELAASLRVAE